MNRDECSELIEEYGRGFDLLNAALAEVPREAWEFKPGPKEWSIHELMVHMKDSEAMGVIRLHKLIAEPGSTLMTYEEDKWSNALDYQSQDLDDALQIFKLLRRTTYDLLKGLSGSVFSYSVTHPVFPDPYTLEKWLRIYTEHVPEHVEQLKQIHRMWKERNP